MITASNYRNGRFQYKIVTFLDLIHLTLLIKMGIIKTIIPLQMFQFPSKKCVKHFVILKLVTVYLSIPIYLGMQYFI